MQPWEFIIVKDKETKKEIAFAAQNQRFIADAPVVIVACSDPRRSWMHTRGIPSGVGWENVHIQDVSAAIQNMLLTAHSMKLGSCWIGAFREEEIKEILEVPKEIKILAIIPIGYPDEDPLPPPRYLLDRVTHINKWTG
ncbi:MAG: nitroreductase family protein [Methanosarcinales archaeon]